MTYYDIEFYNNQIAGSLSSAEGVVPYVYELYSPKTVIDIGCGVGTWASVFEKYGCECVGVDGDYVPKESLLIKKYFPIDISKDFKIDGTFDLVICLEVAEHLPTERSESFIKDLAELSDRILFSAATPGQGGTNHINEQPLEFWEDIFNGYGYVMKDIVRPLIKDLDNVAWWYKNNIVVFEKEIK